MRNKPKNRIRFLRDAFGITAKDLAKKIGLSERMVWYLERGERDPNTEVLNKLAEVFNCSIDYIIGRTSDEEEKLIIVLKEESQGKLTPESLRYLIRAGLNLLKKDDHP